MSNSWQQEPVNNHRSENNPPRGMGGLLSRNSRLPDQQAQPAQQINQPPGPGPATGMNRPSPIPARPVAPTGSSLLSQQRDGQNQQNFQVANGGQYPPANRSAGLVGNTFQTIRGWSGKLSVISNKLAAMAGYSMQPPAPYMERLHSPAYGNAK